jgi:hypothetical protein
VKGGYKVFQQRLTYSIPTKKMMAMSIFCWVLICSFHITCCGNSKIMRSEIRLAMAVDMPIISRLALHVPGTVMSYSLRNGLQATHKVTTMDE